MKTRLAQEFPGLNPVQIFLVGLAFSLTPFFLLYDLIRPRKVGV